jgi:hypothetical protein
VSSPQDHAGRAARLQRFAPAGRTQAPAVAGPQAGKAELGHRRRKIIAAGFGKLEKPAVMTAQTVWLPTSSRLVLQQPSRKNPVLSFIEQTSSRSPRTFPGALGRPRPLPLSSLSIADSWIATMPGEYRHPAWERRLRFRSYRISVRYEKPFASRNAGLRLGVDPLGGTARPNWGPINSMQPLQSDQRPSGNTRLVSSAARSHGQPASVPCDLARPARADHTARAGR